MYGERSRRAMINWRLVILLLILSAVSLLLLYSAGRTPCEPLGRCMPAFGGWRPWALSQLPKVILGFGVLFVVAFIDLKVWIKSAYWIYGAGIIALILVMLVGHTGMGAQRWINLGFMQFQPSEFMKIGLVMALAKYFAGVSIEDIRGWWALVPPGVMTAVPVVLVILQPDLGTALSLAFVAALMFFISGVQAWKFGAAFMVFLIIAPIAWRFVLHDYQRGRVLTFIDPSRDARGAGYHITQSKITIGSGGFWGKGYLEGTQSHLNFLPEKHTDFIFTMLAEEFGMFGALLYFAIIIGILWQCGKIALLSRNLFGKILALGVGINFFVYFFINTAMVMGLLPVVGMPSPLLSYGGTSIIAILFGFGLVQCASVHREQLISSKSSYL